MPSHRDGSLSSHATPTAPHSPNPAMKLLALSLLPLISATTHPTPTKHLLPRSPHNVLPTTLAPLLSLPTTSSTPSVPGSVYVCEKPNSEGHCRYLGEDQVPGAEQCHVIDEGITLGSIEPAACTFPLLTLPLPKHLPTHNLPQSQPAPSSPSRLATPPTPTPPTPTNMP